MTSYGVLYYTSGAVCYGAAGLQGATMRFEPGLPSAHQLQAGARMIDALPLYASSHAKTVLDNKVFNLRTPDDPEWNWNDRAIASLALYGHTIGDDTLCNGVSRRPADWVGPLRWGTDTTIDRSLAALKVAFRKCIDGASNVHLSLSAGYDSRLLLALCLSEGVKPNLSVMGYADSTDVIIAEAISKAVDLPIRRIELQAEDYLSFGHRIAYDTSGVKTPVNWHTWLYAKALDARNGVHLVGSNGEFARSFFFDNPRLNPVANHLPAVAAHAYWTAKITRRRGKFSKHNPILRGITADAFALAHAGMSGLDWKARGFSEALDCFYTQQRVRHFIGAGLACYSEFGTPRSPFLDDGWMISAARLSRKLKQNSFFHAESTRRLVSELDVFPYNSLADGKRGRSYHPFAELCSKPEVTELISESSVLDKWASAADRRAILTDTACNQLEERNLWLTLHFASSPEKS